MLSGFQKGSQAFTQREAGGFEQEVEAAADAALGEVVGGRGRPAARQPDEAPPGSALGEPAVARGVIAQRRGWAYRMAALVPLGVEAAGQLEGRVGPTLRLKISP